MSLNAAGSLAWTAAAVWGGLYGIPQLLPLEYSATLLCALVWWGLTIRSWRRLSRGERCD